MIKHRFRFYPEHSPAILILTGKKGLKCRSFKLTDPTQRRQNLPVIVFICGQILALGMGATGVPSVRCCLKLPQCVIESVPDRSRRPTASQG